MIKAKPNLIYLAITLTGLTIGLIGITNEVLTWTEVSDLLFLLWGLPLWIIIFLKFLNDTSQIEIDEEEIRIKNWLTRKTRKYNLKDFDYRIEHEKWGRGGPYKLLLLTKDSRIVLMITDISYSNYDSIFWGLRLVPILRYPKIGLIKLILFLIGIKLTVEINASA